MYTFVQKLSIYLGLLSLMSAGTRRRLQCWLGSGMLVARQGVHLAVADLAPAGVLDRTRYVISASNGPYFLVTFVHGLVDKCFSCFSVVYSRGVSGHPISKRLHACADFFQCYAFFIKVVGHFQAFQILDSVSAWLVSLISELQLRYLVATSPCALS